MDLVALGAVLWDVFDDRKLIGGAPFNVCAHAAKLGIQGAFISAVGNDELGHEALKQAAQLRLTTQYIRTVEGTPTGTVRVFLEDGQPDFHINRPAAYDFPALSDEDVQRLADARPQWLYYGTLEQMSPTVLSLLGRLLAEMPDARRFYDVNLRKDSYTPELVDRLLGDATVLKINDDEARAIADMLGMGERREQGVCEALAARFGIECICVTRGENGCAIWRGDQFVESPGHSVSLADAVGAGDAFAAALIHGLTAGWNLAEVAAFANKLGALVASRPGAVPDWTPGEIE